MTNIEKEYFDALTKDRTESANTLEKPSMRGIKNSVVEKYSDQAHFIYELLQNADDAHATKVRFVLQHNRLIFAHNGTRQFSVSDPANEESDSETENLGDINAITSIANSNKTAASIGKFGVGFKAVFQYTSTPYIYDPNFRFKIERFIVPKLIEEDFPERHQNETIFVFPFDHPERDAAEAYSDISDKLRNLNFPLLFLSDLRYIKFEFDNVIGLYEKSVKNNYTFGNIQAEHICLTQKKGDDIYDEELWLFSQMDDYQRKYSVGFFLDQECQKHLRPVTVPAFCFFPTKEVTGLNFIIHAPFLLTDSREGIRAGVAHNDRMVQLLAELSAKSIVCLKTIGIKESCRFIDDSIFDIIPYDKGKFSDIKDKSKISFMPFYNSIQETFQSEEILPSGDGYVSSENAYWASVSTLTKLFSNQQLADICDNPLAGWVFMSLGRDNLQDADKTKCLYIDSLVKTNLNEEAIINGRKRNTFYNRYSSNSQSIEPIKGITPQFIEKQSLEWLIAFYQWLSESKKRTDSILKKAIFLDQDKKAAAAFDKEGQLILFLPVENISGYKIVHHSLLENSDTLLFLKKIGIKSPSLRDRIYNIILPLYKNKADCDHSANFKLFFEYYCSKCINGEDLEFVDLIKEYKFLLCSCVSSSDTLYDAAENMYMPSSDLKTYFAAKSEVRFIALEYYRDLAGVSKEKQLESFLSELGVKREIEPEHVLLTPTDINQRNIERPRSTRTIVWKEGIIPGCKEIVQYITENKDEEKSVLLWNILLSIIENYCRFSSLSDVLKGICNYFYRSEKTMSFVSSDEMCLKQSSWLVNRSGKFVNAGQVTKSYLSEKYDTSSREAQDLLKFLSIKTIDETDDSNLTDSQRKKIEFADWLNANGIDKSDLEELIRIKGQREERKRLISEHSNKTSATEIDTDVDDLFNDLDSPKDQQSSGNGKKKRKLNKATIDVVRDIASRTKEKPSTFSDSNAEYDDDIDQDEYTPCSVNYSKLIEQAKQNSAAEIDRITHIENLQKRVAAMQKYSFGWFKTLLELESINSGDNKFGSREVSISFGKVEKEQGTSRTLVLRYPNRYIPQFMEDLSDIPLVLHFGDVKKTVAIEVASIKSYTLRVKLKSGSEIDGIDLSSVYSASIDAKSPVFLLEELKKEFEELGFSDDYNMQENLCENIEFVFGPPGTGKTTHIAKNVIAPLMRNNNECKVLVLTPTNKAADVLVRRIEEVSQNDKSYEEWLVRFGITGDEIIEQSSVFKDKTFDIRKLQKNVTITTIARFPYDFFMPQGVRLFLRELKWDYIIIDEASMIPLVNIIYPIYKKTPKKFIIAGDPFQIEPIASVDLWKDENIYKLVQLNSFIDPKTLPHQYKVELLTTQFRSIPAIGNIFSEFAYDGILKHNRAESSQRPLNVDSFLNIQSLNIIKYPVSKYESIYRSKRLQHSSSYQIYSALFTYEYICHLSKAISSSNPGDLFKIGVIAPYRAQADLIDKLLSSEKLPKEIDVQVGTIHGFQGDECDIVFAVFNTPPTISSSKEMFLNKRNIINVSISRAKDYLFIIMPDDTTENIANLRLVKKIEQLIKNTNDWTESFSSNIEKLIFGESNYLENNSFSTSHQSVNVYGLPEKIYEVRTEDFAVDLQIHRQAKSDVPERHDETVLSFLTSESKIIDDSTENSIETNVLKAHFFGSIDGVYYVVPYKGKLKKYTDKKAVGMFIPLNCSGKEILLSVSVVEEEKRIYIQNDTFKKYEKWLKNSNTIELRKNKF